MTIGIIRINDKNGNNIAETELFRNEYDELITYRKKNIKNVFKEIEQTTQGFVDVIDIDIDKIINKDILNDIYTLKFEQGFVCGIFEDEYGREKYVKEHIENVFQVAEKYNFQYSYNQEEWDKTDNTYDYIELTESDFFNNNITTDNYMKADLVIGSICDDLIIFLENKMVI